MEDNYETFLVWFPRYLEGKIKAGEAHDISCPEYGCYKLVPLVSHVTVTWPYVATIVGVWYICVHVPMVWNVSWQSCDLTICVLWFVIRMLLRELCLEKWLNGFSTLISKHLLTPIPTFVGVPILGVAKQWRWPHLLRSSSILFFKLTICPEWSREVVG